MIKICLEEIERSRPYFVCSLGFRNGWSLQVRFLPALPSWISSAVHLHVPALLRRASCVA